MTSRDVLLGTLVFIAIVALGLAAIAAAAAEPMPPVNVALTDGKGPSIVCVPVFPPKVQAKQQWSWT
jgi:hypothetical protein